MDKSVGHFTKYRTAKTNDRRPFIRDAERCGRRTAIFREVDLPDIFLLKYHLAHARRQEMADEHAATAQNARERLVGKRSLGGYCRSGHRYNRGPGEEKSNNGRFDHIQVLFHVGTLDVPSAGHRPKRIKNGIIPTTRTKMPLIDTVTAMGIGVPSAVKPYIWVNTPAASNWMNAPIPAPVPANGPATLMAPD
jgi:hypothetical protein